MKFIKYFSLLAALSPAAFAADVTDHVLAIQQGELHKLKQNLAQFDRYSIYSPSCSSIFQELAQWKQSSASKRIDIKLVSNKLRTADANVPNFGFASFGEGQMVMEGSNLAGTYLKYYSDRKNGTQAFNVAAPDTVKITLEPRGSGYVNLVTWGNTRLDLEGVICTRDSFGAQMVARYREGNGTSMILVSFHKGE
ncbi:MAG TPA: hypothetical protein VE954_22860 [Oligoflexus sp.]|uniref:hypothetical protein n=1 Tax=Oligoflexus sp. TaxID=1971216 RepID=UPI002D71946B|nr:hypothetical protein [Oligoflexus sp.]HYX35952.1 hypothetical protein [Oligoflexus sp.]